MKVTMNFNPQLLERIDNFAKSNYLTRTSFVSIACNQYLIANEMQSLMSNLNAALIKIAESGQVSEEQMKELEKFKILGDMFNEKPKK